MHSYLSILLFILLITALLPFCSTVRNTVHTNALIPVCSILFAVCVQCILYYPAFGLGENSMQQRVICQYSIYFASVTNNMVILLHSTYLSAVHNKLPDQQIYSINSLLSSLVRVLPVCPTVSLLFNCSCLSNCYFIVYLSAQLLVYCLTVPVCPNVSLLFNCTCLPNCQFTV